MTGPDLAGLGQTDLAPWLGWGRVGERGLPARDCECPSGCARHPDVAAWPAWPADRYWQPEHEREGSTEGRVPKAMRVHPCREGANPARAASRK